ncbi:MAG: diacylglycerol kinase family protein [Candidatus Komeilibacteria bacterium]
MYLYIYDSFLNQPKYATLLARVEQRVTDLDIKGRIARLSILKNLKELIADAVKDGVKTVVAIGDDQTFAKVINVVADLDVVLGIIPVDDKSKIAKILGVPPRELACEVVSGRIIKKLDLGRINNQYFMHSAEVVNAPVSLLCDSFQIAPTTERHTIQLCNFSHEAIHCDPTDGIMEAVITPWRSGWLSGGHPLKSTVLPFKKLMINSLVGEPVSIVTDEQLVMKTPASIEIAPGRLKIIVGSQRSF